VRHRSGVGPATAGPHRSGLGGQGRVQALRALAGETDYLEFDGRPHLHMVAPHWEEVAAGFDSLLDTPLATTEQAS
jgi:hypothetical protein